MRLQGRPWNLARALVLKVKSLGIISSLMCATEVLTLSFHGDQDLFMICSKVRNNSRYLNQLQMTKRDQLALIEYLKRILQSL